MKIKGLITAILVLTLLLGSFLMQPAVAASPPTSMTSFMRETAMANMVRTLWNPTYGAFNCAPFGEPWNHWVDDQGKTLELISQTPDYWTYGDEMLGFISEHTTASGSVTRRLIETDPTVLNGLPTAFDIDNHLLRIYGDLSKSRDLSFKLLYMPQGTLMAYFQGHMLYDGVKDWDLSIVYNPTSYTVTSGVEGGLKYARATQIWDLSDFTMTLDYTLWEDRTYLEVEYHVKAKVDLAATTVAVPLDQLDWIGPAYAPNAPHSGYQWVWIPGYPDQQSNDTEQQHFLPNPVQWNETWYMIHMHNKPDSVSTALAIVADWGEYKSLVKAVDNSLLGEAISGSQRYSPNLHWLKQYADLGPTSAGVTKTFSLKYYFLDAHDWTNLYPTYHEIFSEWDLTKKDPSQLYQYGAVVFGLAKMFKATRDLGYLELLKEIWTNWIRMYNAAGTGTYLQSLPFMLRAMVLLYDLGADPTMQGQFNAAVEFLKGELLETQEMNPSAANYGAFHEWNWYWPGSEEGLTDTSFEAFTNELTNPGFETGALTPWFFNLVTGTGTATVSDGGNAHSGSYAAKVTFETLPNEFWINQTYNILQEFNATYFINNFWIKANVTGYQASVELVQRDTLGAVLSTTSNSPVSVTSSYQQIRYGLELNNRTASLEFRMRVSGTVAGPSELWLDDAVSGSLAPWFYHTFAGTGDIVIEDSGNAHSGNLAAKVISATGTNHFEINQSVTIEGMSTQFFTSSYWVKSDQPGYIAKVEVLQKGDKGQFIRLDGSPGVQVNSTWGQVPAYTLQLAGLTASVEWRMWINGTVASASTVWLDDASFSSTPYQYWGNSYEDYSAPAIRALSDFYVQRDNSTVLSRISTARLPWAISDGSDTYQYPVWMPVEQTINWVTIPEGYIVQALNQSGIGYDYNAASYKSSMILQAFAPGLDDFGYDKDIALRAASWLWNSAVINSTDTVFMIDQSKRETNSETQPWGVTAWLEWMEAASAPSGSAQVVLAALQSKGLMNVTSVKWESNPFPMVYKVNLEIPAGETVQVWVTSYKEISGIYVNSARYPTYSYVWDPSLNLVLISITVPTTGEYLLQVGYAQGYNIHLTYPCFRLTWNASGGVKNMTGFVWAMNKRIVIMNSSATGFDLRQNDPYWTILANDTSSGTNTICGCYDKRFGWVFSNSPMPNSIYGEQTLIGNFTLSGPLHVKVNTGVYDYGPRMAQIQGLTAPYGNGTYWNYRYDLTVHPLLRVSYGQIYITFENAGPGTATLVVVAIVAAVSAGVIYVARKKIKR